jgi:hypothetical protein
MTEKSIHAARRQKREIEQSMAEQLNAFTDETGLAVVALEVERIEITGLGDDTERYRYRVTSQIMIDDCR